MPAAPPENDSSISPASRIPAPPFAGLRHVEFPIAEVLPFLDKASLFRSRWQYQKGQQSDAAYQTILETEAMPALEALLQRDRQEKIFRPQAAYGYFPCRRSGNELIILTQSGAEAGRFAFPRRSRKPQLCLSDYFRSDGTDLIGLWAVTVGSRASELAAEIYQQNHYRDYLHLHGLGIELAETTAELLFRQMQVELGFRPTESGPDLVKAGLRYSFGYPACPDLSQQKLLLELVQAAKIGVSLTEAFVMVPEQSVSGIFIHHPEATYFAP